jgi:hypothetical protein
LNGLAENISMKLLCWFRIGKEKESREIKAFKKHQSPGLN